MWKIKHTERNREKLQSMGLQRVGYNLVTKQQQILSMWKKIQQTPTTKNNNPMSYIV